MFGDKYESASGFKIYYQVVMEHPGTQQVTMAVYDNIGTISEHMTLYDSTVAKLQKISRFPWEAPPPAVVYVSHQRDPEELDDSFSQVELEENEVCSEHVWVPYVGLTESYSYCKVCDEKRE